LPKLAVTSSSPVITKTSITSGGLGEIRFDRDIFIEPEVYNLTSENDGPKYFNLTLIVNPDNVE